MLGSRRQGGFLDLGIMARLGLGRRDIADQLEEAAVVKPIHPLEGSELNGLHVAPRIAAPDHLGLEQADDGLGQGVVVAITDAADRGLDASLEQPLLQAVLYCRSGRSRPAERHQPAPREQHRHSGSVTTVLVAEQRDEVPLLKHNPEQDVSRSGGGKE